MSLPEDKLYLNNAATSFPKPDIVERAVNSAVSEIPMDHRRGEGNRKAAAGTGNPEEVRKKLARFFGVPKDERVVFTPGASHGLNLIVRGLNLSEGDTVLFTNLEHNAVIRPLNYLAKWRGIKLRMVSSNPAGFLETENFVPFIDPTVKALFLNHASNVCGSVQEVLPITSLMAEYGIITIVDASQSAGIEDIDVIRDGIDVLVFTGHKYLYGLTGIGGLYIREGIEPEPLVAGGNGIKSDLPFMPEEMPLRLEGGTGNQCGIVSLGAGIDFINRLGLPRIQQKMIRLRTFAIDGMETILGLRVTGPKGGKSPVISFTMDGIDPGDLGMILEESFGIIGRSGIHCAPLAHKALGTYPAGTMRVSFSWFTEKAGIERLLGALRAIRKAL